MTRGCTNQVLLEVLMDHSVAFTPLTTHSILLDQLVFGGLEGNYQVAVRIPACPQVFGLLSSTQGFTVSSMQLFISIDSRQLQNICFLYRIHGGYRGFIVSSMQLSISIDSRSEVTGRDHPEIWNLRPLPNLAFFSSSFDLGLGRW